MNIKEVNRTVRFDSRMLSSSYRCKYGNKNEFDKLRINLKFEERIAESYEIESKYLPDRDSINFKAKPSANGFVITNWSPISIIPHIEKI